MSIPATARFCWIGTRLPWAYVFAVLSAADRGGLAEVVLHHTDVLEDGPELRALRSQPGVRLELTDAEAVAAEAGRRAGLGDALAQLLARLGHPVMRADLLRAALLYLHGGIYLDLDTITTKSLLPLLGREQFVGREFIVWPREMRVSRRPLRWLRALSLDLLRKLARGLPNGWHLFRRIERFYFRGVNNAVMGAPAGSPLMASYLRGMVALPPAQQEARYGLGPDLLQDVVDRYRLDDLRLEAPQVFYPLPPEVSEHWFRMREHVQLATVLAPETRIVHWYASVRTRARVASVDPAYVLANRYRQLYSALVCECVRRLPEFA